MKTSILIVAAALALASCGGNAQRKTAAEADKVKTTAKAEMHKAEKSLEYHGTYTGTFPAADGPGIEVKLRLKADGRYELHMKYIDRKTDVDEKGKYAVNDNLLTLTPDDGKEVSYYRVEQGQLRKLGADRQPATGALADHYVLRKTN